MFANCPTQPKMRGVNKRMREAWSQYLIGPFSLVSRLSCISMFQIWLECQKV